MTDVSRREALRLGVLGLSGLTAIQALGGCGVRPGTGETVPAPVPALARFDGDRPPGPRTGLPRRVAWVNTSDTEIFVALGRGIEAAVSPRSSNWPTTHSAGAWTTPSSPNSSGS